MKHLEGTRKYLENNQTHSPPRKNTKSQHPFFIK